MKKRAHILILVMAVMALPTFTFAHHPHPVYFYDSYGQQVSWMVPNPVLMQVGRAYRGFDIVHVKQIPYAGRMDFEFVLQQNGTFLSIYVDNYGRIIRSTRLARAPFSQHVCGPYCGYHSNYYQRYYRPQRPVVIYQNRGYRQNPHYRGNKNFYRGKGRYGNRGSDWDEDDYRHHHDD